MTAFYVFIVRTELVFTEELGGFPTSKVAWKAVGTVGAETTETAKAIAEDRFPLSYATAAGGQLGAYYHLEPVDKIDDLMRRCPIEGAH